MTATTGTSVPALEAAAQLALVASLCATCRRLKLDPRVYLRAVFVAIANGTKLEDDAAMWTPWAWAQRQALEENAASPNR